MIPPATILVALDGSARAAAALGCAVWLAQRVGARLHVLSATAQERPAREELARLHVPSEYWSAVTLHQAPSFPEAAILRAVHAFGADLVVLAARGESSEPAADAPDAPDAEQPLVGHVTRTIIEASPVPVLLMPAAYVERLPWRRLLVPISGEPEADMVLALAVRLANALELTVEVVHIADGRSDRDAGLAAVGKYADAAHHEYPARLEALVRRAVGQYSAEECRCIRGITLRRGETGAALAKLIEEAPPSLLVLGWHGRFMRGHAHIVKHLLRMSTSPILLVKPEAPARFSLKVGAEVE